LTDTGAALLVISYTALKLAGSNANQFALAATGTRNAGLDRPGVAARARCNHHR